jgi:hypothetical protein
MIDGLDNAWGALRHTPCLILFSPPEFRGIAYPTKVGSNRRRATRPLLGSQALPTCGLTLAWTPEPEDCRKIKSQGQKGCCGEGGAAQCGCLVGCCDDQRKQGQARSIEGPEEKKRKGKRPNLAGPGQRINSFPRRLLHPSALSFSTFANAPHLYESLTEAVLHHPEYNSFRVTAALLVIHTRADQTCAASDQFVTTRVGIGRG